MSRFYFFRGRCLWFRRIWLVTAGIFLSPEGAEWKRYNSIICQEIRPKRRLSSGSWQHSLGSIFLPLFLSPNIPLLSPESLSSFTTYSVSSPPSLPQGPWLDNWGINSYMKSVNATVSFLSPLVPFLNSLCCIMLSKGACLSQAIYFLFLSSSSDSLFIHFLLCYLIFLLPSIYLLNWSNWNI